MNTHIDPNEHKQTDITLLHPYTHSPHNHPQTPKTTLTRKHCGSEHLRLKINPSQPPQPPTNTQNHSHPQTLWLRTPTTKDKPLPAPTTTHKHPKSLSPANTVAQNTYD